MQAKEAAEKRICGQDERETGSLRLRLLVRGEEDSPEEEAA
ncbi:MAG TPA: hypothetical protein VNO81_04590 [Candidatus Nitrosotenuis sp.]|jgi:hypothetical protein|nr:hypothetical protein [Candidatus Nitrosotenuis sp.]